MVAEEFCQDKYGLAEAPRVNLPKIKTNSKVIEAIDFNSLHSSIIWGE